MSIDRITEPKLSVTYPSVVRIRNNRVVFGVHKATEFTVVPAISRVISLPDKGRFSVETVFESTEAIRGIDLGSKNVDGSDKFNAFGYEYCVDEDDTFASFTTALVFGSNADYVSPIEQLKISIDDQKLLYGLVAVNAMLQIERIVPGLSNYRLP